MKRFISSLLLISLVLLSACSPPGSSKLQSIDASQVQDLSPEKAESLSLPLTNIANLNPLLSKNSDYFHFIQLVYEGLFSFEENGNIQPLLAEHYQISQDGRILSITLKDNVYWQDGEKLTAEDVAMTFNGLKNLPDDSPILLYLRQCVGSTQSFNKETFARAMVFDERNVDIEFDRPYGNMLAMMVFPILPSHLYTEESLAQEENFQLMGTGPFQLASYRKNDEIVLEKNPNYYGPKPYIDEIRGKILESRDHQAQAFDSGQIDLAIFREYKWDRLRDKAQVRLESYETNKLEILSLNSGRPIFQGPQGQALKKAIASAINKQKIVDSLYLQQASVAHFLINPKNNPGFFPENQVYYSTESSKQVLNQAGFTDTNGDGWLETPEGDLLQLDIRTNLANNQRKTQAEFIQDDLKNIGIRTKIVQMETQEDEWGLFQEDLQAGNFDLAIYGIEFSIIPDIASVLYSNARLNFARLSSPKMDEKLSKLALTQDPVQRKQVLTEINELFIEDASYIPLVYKQDILARDAKISEDLNPNMFNIYGGLRDAYISRD
ncbi:MAG: peptide ABC transporter substrate-binding protein [Tissierellia bacterium]|nr:peptide ABC transporter substrate-binding protein [Tissierellia bacterium]